MSSRKIVHITMIGFALLVGRIPPMFISIICLAAFFFNLFILPSISQKSLEKKQDKERGYSTGLLSYPFILFALSILFFEHQVFFVIGWGAMAFGDAFAAIGSRFWKAKTIAWDRSKSWGGVFFFFAIGFPLTFGFLQLLPHTTLELHTADQWFTIVCTALITGAIVETIPGFIDDNLTVPSAASYAAYLASSSFHGAFHVEVPVDWAMGVFAILLFMALSFWSKKIDLGGTFIGGIIAVAIFLGGGFPILGLLLLFFVVGSLASSFRKSQKKEWALAEKNGGKRTATNAIANAGVAALCGLLAWSFQEKQLLFQTMLAASLAAALSDTLSSEMGNVLGKRYINILSGKKDKRGKDGVISLEGTLFGMLGSILVAICFWWGNHDTLAFLAVAIGGMMGNIADSLLGATFQQKGMMNNHSVNVACTLSAACCAWFIYG